MTDNRVFNWVSAAATHVGNVRKLNEDSYLNLPASGLWVVADGMGGHEAGDYASGMIVDALRDLPPPASLGEFVAEVRARIEQVNSHLREEAGRRQSGIIGSTVVALLAHDRHGVLIWAGDSRIYLLRAGELRQLSRDHSHVEEMIGKGLLERENAHNHPASNAITRAVGAADSIELDTEMLEVQDGDVFLLCSDGLYNEIDNARMQTLLQNYDSAACAEQFIEQVLQGAARDNVTVVIARADSLQHMTRTVMNPVVADSA